MIRPANKRDGAAVVGMFEAFHHAIPNLSCFQFSRLRAAQTFLAALERPDHGVFVLDISGKAVGVIILSVLPYPLGQALISKEVIFWINPEHRGKWWREMIGAAEKWAKAQGAMALCLSCFDDGRTVKLFDRAGYTSNEIVTFKVL